MNQANVPTKITQQTQAPATQKIKIFPKPEIKRLKIPPIKPTSEPNQ
jgi:hypothetical protein